MYRPFRILTAAVLLSLFAGQVQAAPVQWKIDPAHTGIYFGVTHIFSTTRGYFEDYSGTSVFDPQDLANSRFEFTVKTKSINTANRKRDGHLRSPDFFDAAKYPDMTFKSRRITHEEGNRYWLEGDLTVKDVTKAVKIPFTFFGTQGHPFNPDQQVAGFEALFSIDRLAYNVGNGKFLEMGVVGKMVNIVISTEMTSK